jgi:ABC-2 type transport system permease protein
MNLRRTGAVARKELLHIRRDPRSFGMALALPMLMLLLFGYALTLDVDRIPALVHDADSSAQSRELIARFDGSRYFDIRGHAPDYGAIERGIDRDEILLGLVIPAGYSRDLLAGREAEIQVLLDGSDSNTASIALGYVRTLLASYTSALRVEAQSRRAGQVTRPPVEARARVWYNSTLESKNYIVPGLIAVILMIIAALLTSLTVAREWEMGTMEQVLSTPLRPTEMLLGKMLAYFAVGVADTVTAVAAGVWIFGVPLRGNILLLAAACGLFLTGALFWGILISSSTRSQLFAYQIAMVTSFLPAFLLSGFIYSIENMPLPIQAATYAVPARYFIEILKGIFLKGVGLEALAAQFGFLLIYAAAVFLAATRRLRQKVA